MRRVRIHQGMHLPNVPRLLACLFLCAGLAAVDYPPTTTLTQLTLPNPIPPLPGYLVPYRDARHGTQVRRITDPTAMGVDLSGEVRISHIYSKNQAWNADGTLLMLDGVYPAQILDGNTYARLRQIRQPSQAMWSNLDPLLTYGRGGNQVVACTMTTGATATVATLSNYSGISLGEGEGNLSSDDAWLAILGTRSDGGRDIAAFSMTSRTVTATLDAGTRDINNCSMSPSGNWIVVQWIAEGRARFNGIEVFDRNLVFQRQLHHHGGVHFDLGHDAAGNEVIVVTNPGSSALVMRRLDTGASTTLLASSLIGYNIHVSCRNLQRPGWAYISEFTGDPNIILPYSQDVFAVRLDPAATGNAAVQRFAQEYHSEAEQPAAYERCAMAVPNRDGSRVLFASDWRNSSGKVHTFVAQAWPRANTLPTISVITDRVIAAGTSTGAIAVTVADAETASAELVLSATSSNPSLAATSAIVLGGSGPDRTVSVTPTAGQTGSAVITVTVSDGAGSSASQAFTLTVTSAPVLPPPNATSNAGGSRGCGFGSGLSLLVGSLALVLAYRRHAG